MNGSFADKIRKLYREIGAGGREVVNKEVTERLDLVFDKEKIPFYNAQRDLRKEGCLKRVRPGVHIYIARDKEPTREQVMWRLLRARRVVTIDDLVEMAGVTENTAREFIQCVQRHGVVRRIKKRTWQMISDPGPEMPVNERKAEKYRRYRRKRKEEALAALDRAFAAVSEARMAVANIEE